LFLEVNIKYGPQQMRPDGMRPATSSSVLLWPLYCIELCRPVLQYCLCHY